MLVKSTRIRPQALAILSSCRREQQSASHVPVKPLRPVRIFVRRLHTRALADVHMKGDDQLAKPVAALRVSVHLARDPRRKAPRIFDLVRECRHIAVAERLIFHNLPEEVGMRELRPLSVRVAFFAIIRCILVRRFVIRVNFAVVQEEAPQIHDLGIFFRQIAEALLVETAVDVACRSRRQKVGVNGDELERIPDEEEEYVRFDSTARSV